MTTPEIDVAPSTVEGGDKPGANYVTTPAYDPTRPDCASCGEAWEDHLGRPFFHCPEQESNYVPLPSPAPVDAAPPKDPDEIERLALDYGHECARHAAGNGSESAIDTARSDLLSAVASLRAEAERAWSALRVQNDLALERLKRATEAESSLEQMRERVQGAADHLGRLYELKQRNVSTIREAYAHAQEIVLAALSPSTPETKDKHR